jgi:hypothetical protein
MSHLFILQVTKVESQIVSGIKYTVTLKLAVTECLKDVEAEKLNECKENTGSLTYN